MYRICGRPNHEQRHSTFSRSGREKRSVKTHHLLWKGKPYTMTQYSTTVDTPAASLDFVSSDIQANTEPHLTSGQTNGAD